MRNHIRFILALSAFSSLLACALPQKHQALQTFDSVEASTPTNDPVTSSIDSAPQSEFNAANETILLGPELEVNQASQPFNLWDRIRAGLSLPHEEHQRITKELSWYKKHPNYIERVCQRAQPFLFDIVSVLEEQKLPLELALLPIVESAFQPYAYSSGRAAGLWQFIPSTGKQLGLKQNWWYDGRRDAYFSTRAAAKYLSQLHRMLDDNWLYALAGYNAGPGNVLKAVRKNKKRGLSTSYWNLNLPNETKAYVPKLLALKELLLNHEVHGVNWCDIPNEPQTQLVTFEQQLDLAIAAELVDMKVEALQALNPGFNRWATPPQGPHSLLFPVDRAQVFKQKEATLEDHQRLRWKQHKVKSGETLSHIALRYNTTVRQIKKSNTLSNNNIRLGQRLLIPTSSAAKSAYRLSSDQRQKQLLQKHRNKFIHIVKKGESWWTISRQHGVNFKLLAKWNHRSHLDPLKIGQKLVVKNSLNLQQGPSVSERIQKVRYPVKRGDSLARISEKFRVNVNEIVRWNGINKQKYLQPGQQLVLYVDITKQSGYP